VSTAVLLQCHVDGGQRVHGPAGVLVTGGKQSLHERPYKLREAALHNALPHRAHQGELQRETFDDSLRENNAIIDLQWGIVSPLECMGLHRPGLLLWHYQNHEDSRQHLRATRKC